MRASEKYKSPYGKAPRKVEDVSRLNPRFEWDEPHYKAYAQAVLSDSNLARLMDSIQYLRINYEQGRASLPEVNQGFRSLFNALIRGKLEPRFYSGPNSSYISFDELKNIEPQIKRPSYTKTILPPPPEFYCIQYIGGVFNAEQQFLKVSENPKIEQGATWSRIVPEEFGPEKLNINPQTLEHQTYKLTFIPQSETPFSDAQVVIALFQP